MSRSLFTQEELDSLPAGSVVANGVRAGDEWVFRKVEGDRWLIYDIKSHSTNRHEDLVRGKDWGAEEGFISLNLPVFLLSESGGREEVEKFFAKFRKELGGSP